MGRVSGSSKLLRDELVHEVIREHEKEVEDRDADDAIENDDEGVITFVTRSNSKQGTSPHLAASLGVPPPRLSNLFLPAQECLRSRL